MTQKVAVIGGGAGGFFSALTCAEKFPDAKIIIFEKSFKVLAKVKISGGGRCNVTNVLTNPTELAKFYPRGGKQLKQALRVFGTTEIREWFESRGVPLKAEKDGRVFPVSDDSQTVIDCLLNEVTRLKIEIQQHTAIQEMKVTENNTFQLVTRQETVLDFDKVIVATGGSPKIDGLQWLADLGHQIEPPIPSLFTFNMPNEMITSLPGVSIPDAIVKVTGTKLEAQGPLLVTHDGMSGPAILKLSAFGARILAEKDYAFELRVSWLNQNFDELRAKLNVMKTELGGRQVQNRNPFLPTRLWEFLLKKAEIQLYKNWRDLSKKELNRLAEALINDRHQVLGKSTFKEEFVTCGGVSLQDIDFKTMESRKVKGLFFSGEVIDIDGVTGGFNFQSAWTTGFIAGSSVFK